MIIKKLYVVKELMEISLIRQDNSRNDGCGSSGPWLLLCHGSSQTLTNPHFQKGLEIQIFSYR